MKTYARIEDNLIIECGEIDIDELPLHLTEITNDLFKKIINLPATFTVDGNGVITDIIPAERPPDPPKPPTEAERITALEETINAMLGL